MRVGSGMTPLESLVMEADEHGYRLEMVGGLGIWEAHPALKHQRNQKKKGLLNK